MPARIIFSPQIMNKVKREVDIKILIPIIGAVAKLISIFLFFSNLPNVSLPLVIP